jgi:TrmH family RNA methyltransferase
MKPIVSEANPHFRRWLRIAGAARAVREEACTLAEGLHLAEAALDAAVAVEAVLLRRGSAHAQIDALLERLPREVVRYELSPALYERLAPVEQGAGLILVVPIGGSPLPAAARADMVYLDGVQDPGNVGALLRSAAAAGVQHVLAGPGTAALWAPKVLRAAMGAHFRLQLHERVPAGQLAGALDGIWIAALAHDAPPLWGVEFPPSPVGWIFGGEGGGISAGARAASRLQVCIPTSNAVESLNVAAAAAICLFERARRRAALP